MTGPMAKANPFRFSTKFQDDETGLLYYGFRYYSASRGRWLSADPIQEMGGANLYAFVYNNPIRGIDRLGLDYYVIIERGTCGVHHRAIVGDDGNGQAYKIELNPDVSRWYEEPRRLCGKGYFNYMPLRLGGGATNWISDPDIIGIHKHVVTTKEQDLNMAANAQLLKKKDVTYCLLTQNCWAIEKCTLTGKTLSERILDALERLLPPAFRDFPPPMFSPP